MSRRRASALVRAVWRRSRPAAPRGGSVEVHRIECDPAAADHEAKPVIATSTSAGPTPRRAQAEAASGRAPAPRRGRRRGSAASAPGATLRGPPRTVSARACQSPSALRGGDESARSAPSRRSRDRCRAPCPRDQVAPVGRSGGRVPRYEAAHGSLPCASGAAAFDLQRKQRGDHADHGRLGKVPRARNRS